MSLEKEDFMGINDVPYLVLLVLGISFMFIAVINFKRILTPDLKKFRVINLQGYINKLRKLFFIIGLLYFAAGLFPLLNLIDNTIFSFFLSSATVLLTLGKSIMDKRYLVAIDSHL